MMAAPRKPKSADHWEALASQWVKHLGEFKTARTARDAMQQGNHLLLLKEASPHGTWRDRINMLGLGTRTAENLMRVACRFAHAPDAFIQAAGTVSKLLELLPLESEQVDALCNGEAADGLTLERLTSMSVLEIRAAVYTATGREPPAPPTKPVRLSVEEERMLRRYRKCNPEGRAALLQVAGLLEHKSAP